MKNEVKKVDFLTEEDQKIYNLTKDEALERLKEAGVSESEQMLVKWCRDGELDAVRIAKGAPKQRGLRVSEKALEVFILTKGGNATALLKRIEELEAKLEKKTLENKELKKKIQDLKEEGVVVPKKKGYNIQGFHLTSDKIECYFTYNRATHTALFDDTTGEVIQVNKNVRGKGTKDITKDVKPEFKKHLEELRAKELATN